MATTTVSSVLFTLSKLLLYISIPIALILGTTWIITTYQFHVHKRKLESKITNGEAMEPLTIPYAVPWIGSSLGFLNEQASFWARIR
jgi:hypothetical protein